MSKIKEYVVNYLGNRGETTKIKRCAKYKDMLIIVFDDYPNEVEISFEGWIYEPYSIIPSNEMIWNKSNYEKIYQKFNKEMEI